MKKTSFILSIPIIVFFLFPLNSLNAQVVELQWNTFQGSTTDDYGYSVARDNSGNVYVAGWSDSTWGSPVTAFNGITDAYVACLDSSGNLLWNTFLGSPGQDRGYGIVLDNSGNIYVTGFSNCNWGTPVHFFGSGGYDVFVACLDSSGNLVWNTFAGSPWDEYGYDIALDSSGQIFISASGDQPGSGGMDIHVDCFDGSGNLIWNKYFGSPTKLDYGYDIALDNSGFIYVTGWSPITWGTPINAHTGANDAVIVCLNSNGDLIWNTFLGSFGDDFGYAISHDNSNNIILTGYSPATWGTPINTFSGSGDAFLACLNSSGNLIWNTFLGSSAGDYGYGIVSDTSGNIYVTGHSSDSWGSPMNIHSGGYDVFVVCLNGIGTQLWNTFIGSSSNDLGHNIFLDNSGNIYVTGFSSITWGSPVNAHSGGSDVFAARLTVYPSLDITANGSDEPLSIMESDSLQLRVSLNRFGSSENVDYWLAYKGPSGWIHYNNTTKKWETGLGVTHQGPLMDLNNKKVFQKSGLTPGVYTFYFGVDMVMNGKVTKSSLYKDEVKVTVTQ